MTLDDLERLHQRARQADAGSDEHQALVEALLTRNLEGVMDHFEQLRDRTSEALYEALRDCLDRHGTMATVVAREVFLRQRAGDAGGGAARARAHGEHAGAVAGARVIAAEDEGLRGTASVVLGWVGLRGRHGDT